MRSGRICGWLCRLAAGGLVGWSGLATACQPEAPIDAVGVADPDSGESDGTDDGAPIGDVLALESPLRFGAQGTSWATFGGGAAIDGRDSTDLTGFAQLTWFIVDDVEFGGEVAAWHFDQEGEDAAGGSLSALIRWHFVNEGRLSLFVDGGIGVLGATDEVPDGGTELNFIPRAGVGGTYRPWDGDMRLMVGLRWHHISNARSSGASDNPSRDGVMLYLGLSVPF